MKKNKKVKEMKPSGKYPALYYQEAGGGLSERIRIIYPDGTGEWRTGYHHEYKEYENGSLVPRACWSYRDQNFDEAIQAMHSWDAKLNYPPAVYLGEIK